MPQIVLNPCYLIVFLIILTTHAFTLSNGASNANLTSSSTASKFAGVQYGHHSIPKRRGTRTIKIFDQNENPMTSMTSEGTEVANTILWDRFIIPAAIVAVSVAIALLIWVIIKAIYLYSKRDENKELESDGYFPKEAYGPYANQMLSRVLQAIESNGLAANQNQYNGLEPSQMKYYNPISQ